MIFVKNYGEPPICEKEILRYAGCKNESDLPAGLLKECLIEAGGVLKYRVCYSVFDLSVNGENCDFGAFSVTSRYLAKNLCDCEKAVVVAATVGVGVDRLISKYGAVSPARAVIFDAIGTERIEALLDAFCADIGDETGLSVKPRLSPGYGDIDLSYQKDLFSVLDCQRKIGLTLNSSMLMSPSKSVTAIAGLAADYTKKPDENKCAGCTKTNCAYKR